MNEIIELMERYDLTLRRLSSKEVSYTECREGDENNPNVEEVVRTRNISKEKFEFEELKGWRKYQRFVPYTDDPSRGNAVGKMIRVERLYSPGWIVMIDHSHGNVQRWDYRKTFKCNTADEAVMKAVAYIEGLNKR